MRTARRSFGAAAYAAVAATLASSCSAAGPEELPEPPDVFPLVSTFVRPRGVITEESVLDILSRGNATMLQVTDLDLGDGGPLREAVNAIGADLSRFGGDKQGASGTGAPRTRDLAISVGQDVFAGRGFLRVERICNGWDGATVPNSRQDGRVRLMATFTETRIDSVVWGEFEDCRYLSESSRVLLDGAVSIYLGDFVPFADLDWDTLEPLVSVSGQIAIDDNDPFQRLDFRTLRNTTTEVRVPVRNAEVIFWERGALTGLRAANGDWTCRISERECESGEEVLAW